MDTTSGMRRSSASKSGSTAGIVEHAAERPPWEIIETFPSTDRELIKHWNDLVERSATPAARARSLIGRALTMYWAVQEGATDMDEQDVIADQRRDLDEALSLARASGSPSQIAEALLGSLYATWGPDHLTERDAPLKELTALAPTVDDQELRLRILEWRVIDRLDHADIDAVSVLLDIFEREASDTDLIIFRRREVLWKGCLAMLDGRIDESVQINQQAISSSADLAGSPFSFQNVAITLAIERYLRRSLDDMVDPIRSILASSPRVAANWETGLTFALCEIGEFDEAREHFETLSAHRFAAVPRDLNWLVTMQLLGLAALTLGDEMHGAVLLDELRPFAALDATHGSGYASYGPVARVVGALALRWGDPAEGERWFDHVFSTRRPGPWTTLTRYDRAVARRGHDDPGALADAVEAASEFTAMGLGALAERADSLASDLRVAGHGGPVAVCHDDRWTLRHPAGGASVPVGIGAAHLIHLLARPGQIIDVFELDPAADTALITAAGVESSLDHEAKTSYRRRAAVLSERSTLTSAESDELAFLRRELAGAQHRVSISSEVERARVRVTKAIRRTIDAIATQSPSLAEHLRSSVSTGRTCCYSPSSAQAWHVSIDG